MSSPTRRSTAALIARFESSRADCGETTGSPAPVERSRGASLPHIPHLHSRNILRDSVKLEVRLRVVLLELQVLVVRESDSWSDSLS